MIVKDTRMAVHTVLFRQKKVMHYRETPETKFAELYSYDAGPLRWGGTEKGTHPDEEALGVAGVFGPLPPGPTPVAQLPTEHGPQSPLWRLCKQNCHVDTGRK